jgi:ornithine carbamoyltransferase
MTRAAHVTYLGPSESQLGHKESMKDTARVLGRMFDGIEYRGSAQATVDTFAAFAGVPVWNGPDRRLASEPDACRHSHHA